MPRTPENDEPKEGYESPKVEEVSGDSGPAVTAAGDSPTDEAISLIEEEDE